MTLTLNNSNWDQLIENTQLPVVVDFWAEWCGSCISLVGPLMDTMAKEFEGKAIIAKINVDENPSIASKYGVRNLPTVLFFQNGQVKDKMVGAVPKTQMQQKIEAQIKG